MLRSCPMISSYQMWLNPEYKKLVFLGLNSSSTVLYPLYSDWTELQQLPCRLFNPSDKNKHPTLFHCIFHLVWVLMSTTQNIKVGFWTSKKTLFSKGVPLWIDISFLYTKWGINIVWDSFFHFPIGVKSPPGSCVHSVANWIDLI